MRKLFPPLLFIKYKFSLLQSIREDISKSRMAGQKGSSKGKGRAYQSYVTDEVSGDEVVGTGRETAKLGAQLDHPMVTQIRVPLSTNTAHFANFPPKITVEEAGLLYPICWHPKEMKEPLYLENQLPESLKARYCRGQQVLDGQVDPKDFGDSDVLRLKEERAVYTLRARLLAAQLAEMQKAKTKVSECIEAYLQLGNLSINVDRPNDLSDFIGPDEENQADETDHLRTSVETYEKALEVETDWALAKVAEIANERSKVRKWILELTTK